MLTSLIILEALLVALLNPVEGSRFGQVSGFLDEEPPRGQSMCESYDPGFSGASTQTATDRPKRIGNKGSQCIISAGA